MIGHRFVQHVLVNRHSPAVFADDLGWSVKIDRQVSLTFVKLRLADRHSQNAVSGELDPPSVVALGRPVETELAGDIFPRSGERRLAARERQAAAMEYVLDGDRNLRDAFPVRNMAVRPSALRSFAIQSSNARTICRAASPMTERGAPRDLMVALTSFASSVGPALAASASLVGLQ